MAELHDFGTRAGARAFQRLLRDVHARAEADLEAFHSAHPDRVCADGRDYVAICSFVRSSIDSNLSHGDAAHGEGFLRALTDLLCIQVDGCTPDLKDWDPIKNTAAAFGRRSAAQTLSHGEEGTCNA